MSYSFSVPAQVGEHCTAETFDETAQGVLNACLAAWPDGEQKTLTRQAAERALDAVGFLVDEPSVVGETFGVSINGHAPDTVSINLYRIVVAAPSTPAEEPGRFAAAQE